MSFLVTMLIILHAWKDWLEIDSESDVMRNLRLLQMQSASVPFFHQERNINLTSTSDFLSNIHRSKLLLLSSTFKIPLAKPPQKETGSCNKKLWGLWNYDGSEWFEVCPSAELWRQNVIHVVKSSVWFWSLLTWFKDFFLQFGSVSPRWLANEANLNLIRYKALTHFIKSLSLRHWNSLFVNEK